LRQQVSLERVLMHLGLFNQLRGSGPQRRGCCPVHGHPGERERTFSVHLGKSSLISVASSTCPSLRQLGCAVRQCRSCEAASSRLSCSDELFLQRYWPFSACFPEVARLP
jgi:hypothetical protein